MPMVDLILLLWRLAADAVYLFMHQLALKVFFLSAYVRARILYTRILCLLHLYILYDQIPDEFPCLSFCPSGRL